MSKWFDVDKAGLAKLLHNKSKAFVLFELVQNCWDTGATEVDIKLTKLAGRPFAELVVTDNDPDGFTDLTHAYTLFAESEKKDNPEQRGRFNLGEKLVLALCKDAKVHSTTGTVYFKDDGTRTRSSRDCRESGSVFHATIRMNQAECDQVFSEVHQLIPPKGVTTTFNGLELEHRDPIASFKAILPTLRADDEGNIKPTNRMTVVNVYDPFEGQDAQIYEMGIPVVATGDRYHVDVLQKVPLNMDRDNIQPSYRRKLRALVLNHTAELLTDEEASEAWVAAALEAPEVSDEAINSTLDSRYGKKRAVFDPSDREANERLQGEGYTIIHGGAFAKETWKRIRASGAAEAAGKIRPTPKARFGEDGEDVSVSDLTPGMEQVIALTKRLGHELLHTDIKVSIVRSKQGFTACFGQSHLTFNLFRLGHAWFNEWRGNISRTLDLIVHEFGHHYSASHLHDNYHEALSRMAGRLTELALEEPGLFDEVPNDA